MKYIERVSLLAVVCVLPSVVACDGDEAPADGASASSEHFSFFVTSLKAMQALSGNEDGFGGDLRFGETGEGAGLRGADKICATIAEQSMPGNGKTWRAFLSTTGGEGGEQVDAIDRVGEGPWYDRAGRLVAANKTDLVQTRPEGADPAIIDDLPNEDGVPNHMPDPTAGEVDNHDVLTGTNDEGRLFSTAFGDTCNDWTSSEGPIGRPRCGHSWPRSGGAAPMAGPMGGPGAGGAHGGIMFSDGGAFGEGGAFSGGSVPGRAGAPQIMGSSDLPQGAVGSGDNWMSALDEAGCAPGAFVIENGPPGANGTASVGDGGGYGGIYCFALTP
jgi:hypothetical protein